MPDDPKNARNRRLSIVLLRGTGHQPVPQQQEQQESSQEQPEASGRSIIAPIVAPIVEPNNAPVEDQQPVSSPLFDDEETQQ